MTQNNQPEILTDEEIEKMLDNSKIPLFCSKCGSKGTIKIKESGSYFGNYSGKYFLSLYITIKCPNRRFLFDGHSVEIYHFVDNKRVFPFLGWTP